MKRRPLRAEDIEVLGGMDDDESEVLDRIADQQFDRGWEAGSRHSRSCFVTGVLLGAAFIAGAFLTMLLP